MSRNSGERLAFILLSFLLFIVSASYVPTVYGNDPTSIERYLAVHEGRRLGDHVEILAVEDVGEDRFAVFRLETKRPDERYLVRFRRNEQGNYEAYYGYVRRMLGRETGLYRGNPGSYGGDQGNYFVGWIENPKAAEVYVRFGPSKETWIRLTEAPQCVVLYDPYSYVTEYRFHAADGSEL
jgi:hypothetical protein